MLKLPDTFAVFILTHGRPDNVITYKTLQKCGYTGRLYFVVDNEDKTIERYKQNFGRERVLVFQKKDVADDCDEGNNFDERRTILMARNACFDLAKTLGVTHFLQLDDDYTSFEHRKLSNDGIKLLVIKVVNLNLVILQYLDFYALGNFLSISFAQGGDFIGGVGSGHVKNGFPLYRKAMNSFFCSTKRPFSFVGAMNEDVNTYTTLGSRGGLFGMIPMIAVVQKATQSQLGGITEMYNKFGTYCKAFTTVMMMPSSVCVGLIPGKHRRIHHSIDWARTVPCIIRQEYKKTI